MVIATWLAALLRATAWGASATNGSASVKCWVQSPGPFRSHPQRPKGHGLKPLFSRNSKDPDPPQLSSLHRFPLAFYLGMSPRKPRRPSALSRAIGAAWLTLRAPGGGGGLAWAWASAWATGVMRSRQPWPACASSPPSAQATAPGRRGVVSAGCHHAYFTAVFVSCRCSGSSRLASRSVLALPGRGLLLPLGHSLSVSGSSVGAACCPRGLRSRRWRVLIVSGSLVHHIPVSRCHCGPPGAVVSLPCRVVAGRGVRFWPARQPGRVPVVSAALRLGFTRQGRLPLPGFFMVPNFLVQEGGPCSLCPRQGAPPFTPPYPW